MIGLEKIHANLIDQLRVNIVWKLLQHRQFQIFREVASKVRLSCQSKLYENRVGGMVR